MRAIYGMGRLAFGASLMAAPAQVGRLLLGDEAERPGTRASLRTYGTRDTVLGIGAMQAAAAGRGVRPWIWAGVGSDVLDAALQITEWDDLPEYRRTWGLLAAAGSAGVGLLLLRD